MNKPALMKLAASSLVLGATLVGCNPSAKQIGIASASTKAVRGADSAAAKAEKALKGGDHATAIAQAERAVAASPRDPAYRMLLGQAYLAGGRFVSAEAAFHDTLTLDPANGRAALNLALVQIGLGRPDIARNTLARTGELIGDTDRGLALALAGDTAGAIDTLTPAARAEGAGAQVRQNLALAYALAGQWAEARTIAAQDVPGDQLDQRLAGWAAFASPRNSWDQVAALLGVKFVLDRGQPEALALAPDAGPVAPQQALAQAETPEQMFAPTEAEAGDDSSAPVEVAAAEPAPAAAAASEPVETAQASAPAAVLAAIQQVVFGPREEVVQPIPASLIRAANAPAKQRVAVRAAGQGKFVVQLGSFSNAARAEAAWKRAVGRYGSLAAYAPSGEAFRAGAGTVHRMGVSGFASRAEANQVCASVRASGGECFVRAATSQPQAQWAQRAAANTRLAAR